MCPPHLSHFIGIDIATLALFKLKTLCFVNKFLIVIWVIKQS
jgi:hypothetical protein